MSVKDYAGGGAGVMVAEGPKLDHVHVPVILNFESFSSQLSPKFTPLRRHQPHKALLSNTISCNLSGETIRFLQANFEYCIAQSCIERRESRSEDGSDPRRHFRSHVSPTLEIIRARTERPTSCRIRPFYSDKILPRPRKAI